MNRSVREPAQIHPQPQERVRPQQRQQIQPNQPANRPAEAGHPRAEEQKRGFRPGD
jgi:hypothetical protein